MAISKLELEKAIENGDSVWVANKYCYPYEVNLTNNHYIDIADNKESLMLAHIDDVELIDYSEYIFETKEKAQHYHDHSNITRVEQLPFLTWEDIENYISNMKHFGLNRNDRVLARIITKDSIYYFKLCKDFDLFTFQLKQTYIGEDLCEQIRDKFPVSLGEATEANFYKAYDECVRLFRGEV